MRQAKGSSKNASLMMTIETICQEEITSKEQKNGSLFSKIVESSTTILLQIVGVFPT